MEGQNVPEAMKTIVVTIKETHREPFVPYSAESCECINRLIENGWRVAKLDITPSTLPIRVTLIKDD